MNVNFEKILTEAKFFLDNDLSIHLNSLLFLEFTKYLEVPKKDEINRLLFYFENFFKKILNKDCIKYISHTIVNFSSDINNYLIEYIFEELNLNKRLLLEINTRKHVVFCILLSFYTAMNSYKEILNFSNSIFSKKSIKEKIIDLVNNDYANLMKLNLSVAINNCKCNNYMENINCLSKIIINNNYHNYIRFRHSFRKNNNINFIFIRELENLNYIFINFNKEFYISMFFEKLEEFWGKIYK